MFEGFIQSIAGAYGELETDTRLTLSINLMWSELALDSVQRAQTIRLLLDVEETDDPEPYDTAGQMLRDIDGGDFVVSREHSKHPLWTVEENVAFRIVHDVLGHYKASKDMGWTPHLRLGDSLAATAGFDWEGECAACGAHVKLLSSPARMALFTECLGQTAYAIDRGGFTDQRVGRMMGGAFLLSGQAREFMLDAQHWKRDI